jgi:hypothetical protein
VSTITEALTKSLREAIDGELVQYAARKQNPSHIQPGLFESEAQPKLSKDLGAGHWITINSGQDNKGGHKVFIGDDGKMKTGIHAGKTFSEAFGGKSKAEKSKRITKRGDKHEQGQNDLFETEVQPKLPGMSPTVHQDVGAMGAEKSAEKENKSAEKPKRDETYFKGDRAEYTGKMVDGFHEVEMMEGIHKGKNKLVTIAPDGSDPERDKQIEKERADKADREAKFRKLRESGKYDQMPPTKPQPLGNQSKPKPADSAPLEVETRLGHELKQNQSGLWAWFKDGKQVTGAYRDKDQARQSPEMEAKESIAKTEANQAEKRMKASADANDKQFADSHEKWKHLSDKQIENMIERDESAAKSLQNDREFDGMGGRRSGAAMANQGAREAFETAREARRYLDARKSKPAEKPALEIAAPVDNASAKSGDQMGLFGEVANTPKPKPTLGKVGETKGQQVGLFETDGDPDQMLLFDDGVATADRTWNPEEPKKNDSKGLAAKLQSAGIDTEDHTEVVQYAKKRNDDHQPKLFDTDSQQKMDLGEGRWITIRSSAEGKGGHPVFIDKSGTMKTGKFAGQSLEQAFAKSKSKPKAEQSQLFETELQPKLPGMAAEKTPSLSSVAKKQDPKPRSFTEHLGPNKSFTGTGYKVGDRFEHKGQMYEVTRVDKPYYLSARDAEEQEDIGHFGVEKGWHAGYQARPVDKNAEELKQDADKKAEQDAKKLKAETGMKAFNDIAEASGMEVSYSWPAGVEQPKWTKVHSDTEGNKFGRGNQYFVGEVNGVKVAHSTMNQYDDFRESYYFPKSITESDEAKKGADKKSKTDALRDVALKRRYAKSDEEKSQLADEHEKLARDFFDSFGELPSQMSQTPEMSKRSVQVGFDTPSIITEQVRQVGLFAATELAIKNATVEEMKALQQYVATGEGESALTEFRRRVKEIDKERADAVHAAAKNSGLTAERLQDVLAFVRDYAHAKPKDRVESELEEQKEEEAKKAEKASSRAAAKSSKPAVSQSSTARSTSHSATWTKTKSGAWGARIESDTAPQKGDTVTVRSKDGRSSKKKVSKVVWSGDGTHVVEVYSALYDQELVNFWVPASRLNADSLGESVKYSAPSESQAEAENYKMDHISMKGLKIYIETRKGKKRKPNWPAMPCDYGYIKGTMGRDGDHVDVFVGPDRDSDFVAIVDQVNADGKFDEHKCLLGFHSEADAIDTYKKAYSPGWKVGPVSCLTIEQFKHWLKSGDQKKPAKPQVVKYTSREDNSFLSLLCDLVPFPEIVRYEWNESNHPRWPAGSDQGGEFRPTGKTGSGSSQASTPGSSSAAGSSATSAPRKPRSSVKRELADRPDVKKGHHLHFTQLAPEMQEKLLTLNYQLIQAMAPVTVSESREVTPEDKERAAEAGWGRVDKEAIRGMLEQLNELDRSTNLGNGYRISDFVNANGMIPRDLAVRLDSGSRFFDPEKLRGKVNAKPPAQPMETQALRDFQNSSREERAAMMADPAKRSVIEKAKGLTPQAQPEPNEWKQPPQSADELPEVGTFLPSQNRPGHTFTENLRSHVSGEKQAVYEQPGESVPDSNQPPTEPPAASPAKPKPPKPKPAPKVKEPKPPKPPKEPKPKAPKPPKPPKKSTPGSLSKQAMGKLNSAIKDAIGDNPEAVDHFRGVAMDAWKQLRDDAENHNDALRQIAGFFGKHHGALASNLTRGVDPSKIKGFDEMVDHAVREYPQLVSRLMGESSAGGPEDALVDAFREGIREVPKPHDEAVINRAIDLVGPGFFESLDQPQGNYEDVVEDEEFVPFSAHRDELVTAIVRYWLREEPEIDLLQYGKFLADKVKYSAWKEEDHPRGQPENKGQFVEKESNIANQGNEILKKKMFHGSNSKTISHFIPGNRGDSTDLIWSGKKSYAAQYGPHVHQVEVSYSKPFDVKKDKEAKKIWDQWIEEEGAYSDGQSDEGYADDGHIFFENNDAAWALARQHGYDALVSSEGKGRAGIGVPAKQVKKWDLDKLRKGDS